VKCTGKERIVEAIGGAKIPAGIGFLKDLGYNFNTSPHFVVIYGGWMGGSVSVALRRDRYSPYGVKTAG